MSQLRALILDVDGTMAHTEEVHRQAFNAAFKDFYLDWYWSCDEYTELLAISGGYERLRYFVENLGNGFKRPPDLDDYIVKLHQLKSKHYTRMLVEGQVHLRHGVQRLISEARNEGICLAIATSTSFSNVKSLLDLNLPGDWSSWFSVIATSNIIDSKKPSPAVYKFVLEEMGLRGEQCLAIEDTASGLKAATSAGIKTLITPHSLTCNEDFSGAELVVDTLGGPAKPFCVASGTSYDSTYVDIALLKRLLNSKPMTAATHHSPIDLSSSSHNVVAT